MTLEEIGIVGHMFSKSCISLSILTKGNQLDFENVEAKYVRQNPMTECIDRVEKHRCLIKLKRQYWLSYLL